jgi:peptidoglycan/xylan/chitin deacetylase (PgdA/CDA1 family)
LVSLEALVLALRDQTALPQRAVVFTMDDGFQDQGDIAAPIFLEFECPVTFFVITGLLDRTLWPWDAQVSWIIDNSTKPSLQVGLEDESVEVHLRDLPERRSARQKVRDLIKEMDAEHVPDLVHQLATAADVALPPAIPAAYQPLDWGMARQLEAQGVRFAPHSRSHRILSKLRRSSVEDEICVSWSTLQRELSNPLKVFCYPTGRIFDFGPREIEILKNEGFLGAAATIPGFVEPDLPADKQLFSLPRFELPDNLTDFIQYCSWIEHARHAR